MAVLAAAWSWPAKSQFLRPKITRINDAANQMGQALAQIVVLLALAAAGKTADIVTDPAVQWTNQTGPQGALFTNAGDPARWKAIVIRDGIQIKVFYEPAGKGVITAHPVH